MDQSENLTLLTLDKKPDFVETAFIQDIRQRALMYISAGYPVHFTGPAGAGKTALAMHVAAELDRHVILIHGEDEFRSSDLVGENYGYRSTQVIDNYVHSVIKKEENVTKQWIDNRLTSACKYGYTLIYDEFTRSRPEANNVLLSVLEERLLVLPSVHQGERYIQVHPHFSAIFTSNPEDYAGVHKTQDALTDRMITLKLDHHDAETEIAITQAKSGLSRSEAQAIVGMIREIRTIGANASRPTIRACIMLSRLVAIRGTAIDASDPVFRKICHDVVNMGAGSLRQDHHGLISDQIDIVIQKFCAVVKKRSRVSAKSLRTSGHPA